MKKIFLILFVSFTSFLFAKDVVKDNIFELIENDKEKAIEDIKSLELKDLYTIKDKKGRFLINHAAFVGSKDVLELLINRMGVNSRDDLGFTPLHDAVIGGKIDIVKFLISKGANPNISDNRGIPPLFFAIKLNNKEIFELLLPITDKDIKDYERKNILHYTVYYKSLEFTKVVIATNKSLINQTDINGRSPLHYAASSGNVQIVKILLESGADPNIKDYSIDYRKTPLDNAANEEVRNIIISYGGKTGSYNYRNSLAFGPVFYRTDFDSPIKYYGLGIEYYVDEMISFYWSFSYGKNDGYDNYRLGGLGFALHNLFTLWQTSYDKKYEKNETWFKVLLGLSSILPEGFYINFYRNDMPFLFYSIFVGLASIDMASSNYDKDFYVSGAIGGRASFIPFDNFRITLFFNLKLTYNTGNGGYEMGASMSYRF